MGIGSFFAGPFGVIAEGVNKALGIAENLTRKSQEGQLIDAGEAKGLVKTLEAVNENLAKLKAAADRIDTDPAYAARILREYTTDE